MSIKKEYIVIYVIILLSFINNVYTVCLSYECIFGSTIIEEQPPRDMVGNNITIEELLKKYTLEEIIRFIFGKWIHNTVQLIGQLSQLILFVYYLEFMFFLWMLLLTWLVCQYIIKGRPEEIASVQKEITFESNIDNKQSTEVALQPNFTVFNSMQCSDGGRSDKTSNSGNYPTSIMHALHKPDKLNETMDVTRWLKIMEAFLKFYDKEVWFDLVILYLDITVIKKLDLDKIYSYEDLKGNLIKLSDNKEDKALVKRHDVTLSTLCNRRQRDKETIDEYGKDLLRIANLLFPHWNEIQSVEHVLKNTFVEGLFDTRLREEVKEKLLKMNTVRSEEKFTIYDLIQYTENKYNSFETKSRVSETIHHNNRNNNPKFQNHEPNTRNQPQTKWPYDHKNNSNKNTNVFPNRPPNSNQSQINSQNNSTNNDQQFFNSSIQDQQPGPQLSRFSNSNQNFQQQVPPELQLLNSNAQNHQIEK